MDFNKTLIIERGIYPSFIWMKPGFSYILLFIPLPSKEGSSIVIKRIAGDVPE